MWDPISVFAICWMLNVGLPSGRLSVKEAIEIKENTVIVDSINSQIKLRSGL